ncbi:MAG: biotin/lipoyl-binding protein, partial [Clostridiales bacterium]|nr:biotin/lipoyl-binding protein [Clostridiales bacterium]
MKKKALILMLSGVLLLSACSDKSESSEIIKFPIVEANSGYTEYTVKTEDFAVYKEFSAKIAFPYAQEVRYGKEGKITSILAKEGMTVKKDEVLATIDDTEIQ